MSKKITIEEIEKNLLEMIGQEFDANDIICAFEDFNDENREEQIIVSEVEGKNYNYLTYAEYHGPQFGIVVEDGIIKNIWKF